MSKDRTKEINHCRQAIKSVASPSGSLTLWDFKNLFENSVFISALHSLFDHDVMGTLTFKYWLEHLRINLQGDSKNTQFSELYEMLEKLNFKKEGILTSALLQEILSESKVSKCLFIALHKSSSSQGISSPEYGGTISAEDVIAFIETATKPCQRGFSCILEGDMQKIIANLEQLIGLSANLNDFCQLAGTSDAYLCERLFRAMDKKRDDMVSLDEFKEFFKNLSTSDFASLTEFLFQIFDTNDNGKLSASELAFVFKTSVSAMNKSYDEVQIKEIVEALWEDWGLDSHKDDLEISKVREMLSTHEGLSEGLTKSILQLVMEVLSPFSQDTKEGEKEKDRILFSSWWTNLQRYVANLDRTQCKASPPVQRRTGSKKWGHLNRKSLTSVSNSLVSLCTGSDGVAKTSILRQIIEDTGVRWSDLRLKPLVKAIEEIQTTTNGVATVTDLQAMEKNIG